MNDDDDADQNRYHCNDRSRLKQNPASDDGNDDSHDQIHLGKHAAVSSENEIHQPADTIDHQYHADCHTDDLHRKARPYDEYDAESHTNECGYHDICLNSLQNTLHNPHPPYLTFYAAQETYSCLLHTRYIPKQHRNSSK